MVSNTVLQLNNVSKKFCKSLRMSMAYALNDIGRNVLGCSSRSELLRKNEFWGVDDVSFDLEKGETIGLLGANGSGKTTLLKMISGIFWPDKGSITIKGRVGALLEVGAGLHPLLTGRENIYVTAAIMGMPKTEVDRNFDRIVDFADIDDFIDAPVKFYSSGMTVRLGFSIAAHCEPDILLVDEVLSVGDMAFRSKCYKKMSELRQKCSIIMVSHYIPAVQNIAEKCLVLSGGRPVFQGDTLTAVSRYYELFSSEDSGKGIDAKKHYQSDILKVDDIKILRGGSEASDEIHSGDPVEFRVHLSSSQRIVSPQVTLTFNSDTYSGFCTKYDSFDIKEINGKSVIKLKIKALGLGAGNYSISLGIWDDDMLNTYYWNWEAAKLKVFNPKQYIGRFEFSHEWDSE